MKVSYQATSIQKPVLDCLCPLRDCLLFTKDRLILVSIILAAAKTCGFSAGLVTGRSLLRMLEHIEHGVEHRQHDNVALDQPASVQGWSLRISNFLSCQAH